MYHDSKTNILKVGNERGGRERKIERKERRETEKPMNENGFFPNLTAIKILSHRKPKLCFRKTFKLTVNIIYLVLTTGDFLS